MEEEFKIITPDRIKLGEDFIARLERVEQFPIPPDGSLLRVEGNPKVYWMEKGERRWIQTGKIFKKMGEDLGFTQADIRLIEAWQMKTIPLGRTISQWPETWPEPSIDKILFSYLPIRQNNEYWGLGQAKELGFEIMHSHKMDIGFWQEQMNMAQDLSMKCLVQVPEQPDDEQGIKQYVESLREHPAVWGWVSYDDVDFRNIKKEDQIKLYELIKKYDNKHPIGVTACSSEWEKYLCLEAFDTLYYQVYAYRDAITDPDAWLNWMCNRLADYDLTGKRIIPVIQTFGPRGDFHKPQVEHSYNLVRDKLGVKSCACYDWKGIVNHPEFRDAVKKINKDI